MTDTHRATNYERNIIWNEKKNTHLSSIKAAAATVKILTIKKKWIWISYETRRHTIVFSFLLNHTLYFGKQQQQQQPQNVRRDEVSDAPLNSGLQQQQQQQLTIRTEFIWSVWRNFSISIQYYTQPQYSYINERHHCCFYCYCAALTSLRRCSLLVIERVFCLCAHFFFRVGNWYLARVFYSVLNRVCCGVIFTTQNRRMFEFLEKTYFFSYVAISACLRKNR